MQYDLSDNYFPVHMNATVDLHIWEPFIGTEFSIRCVITSFENDFLVKQYKRVIQSLIVTRDFPFKR